MMTIVNVTRLRLLTLAFVMAKLDLAIHVLLAADVGKTWIPATSAGMTHHALRCCLLIPPPRVAGRRPVGWGYARIARVGDSLSQLSTSADGFSRVTAN